MKLKRLYFNLVAEAFELYNLQMRDGDGENFDILGLSTGKGGFFQDLVNFRV